MSYNKELWCKVSEFDTPKRIIVKSLRRLCGEDTTAKEEFRDEDGCVYRMVFEDVDKGMERQFEIKWKSFIQDVEAQRVVKGVTYIAQRTHDNGKWKWVFAPAQAGQNGDNKKVQSGEIQLGL